MKFKDFVQGLLEYESDTFSTSGKKMLKREANNIAERMLESFWDYHVDGIWILEILEEIRDKKQENKEKKNE